MSLATRIESLVIRVAQEFNDVRATAGNLAKPVHHRQVESGRGDQRTEGGGAVRHRHRRRQIEPPPPIRRTRSCRCSMRSRPTSWAVPMPPTTRWWKSSNCAAERHQWSGRSAAVNQARALRRGADLTVAEQLQAAPTSVRWLPPMSATPTHRLRRGSSTGRWPDEPRVRIAPPGGAHRLRGQDQDRRHAPRLARVWVCFGYVGEWSGRDRQRAQRRQRRATAAGRYRVTISPWRCRMRTTAGRRSPAAAPTAARSVRHRARHLPTTRPLSTSTSPARRRQASFDDSSEINLVVYR